MSAQMKPELATLQSAVLAAIRAESRALSLEELRRLTERDNLDAMDLWIMIEDDLIYPTDRRQSMAKYFIRGEASEPEWPGIV